MSEEQRVKKPKRHHRLRVLLPVLVLFLVAGAIAVNLPRLQQLAIHETIAILTRLTRAEITYDRVEGNLLRQLAFYGVRVVLPSGDSLHCGRAAIAFELPQLLRARFRIQRVELDRPDVFVTGNRAPGNGNGKSRTAFRIRALEVRDGCVTYDGEVLAEAIALSGRLGLDSLATRVTVTQGSARVGTPGTPVRGFGGRVVMNTGSVEAESVYLSTEKSRVRFGLYADLPRRRYVVDLPELALDLAELRGMADWAVGWPARHPRKSGDGLRYLNDVIPDTAVAHPAWLKLLPTGKLAASGQVQLRLPETGPAVDGWLDYNLANTVIPHSALPAGMGNSNGAGVKLARLEGKVKSSNTRVTVNADLDDPTYGRLKVSGAASWRSWEYEVDARAEALDLRALLALAGADEDAPIPGLSRPLFDSLVAGDAKVSGRLRASGLGLARTSIDLGLRATGLPLDTLGVKCALTGRPEWSLAVEQLLVTRTATAGQPGQQVTVAGRFNRAGLDAQARCTNLKLDFLLPLARVDVATAVTGQVAATGSYRRPALRGELATTAGRVDKFSFDSLGTRFEIPDIAELVTLASGGSGRTPPTGLSLSAGIRNAAFNGTVVTRGNAELASERFSAAAELGSGPAASIAGTWTRTDKGVAAAVASMAVKVGHELLKADGPFAATWDGAQLTVRGLATQVAGGRATLDLRTRPGDLPEIELAGENVDLNTVAGMLGIRDSVRGRVDLFVRDAPHSADAVQRDVYLADFTASDVRFPSLGADARHITGRLQVNRREVLVENVKLVHENDTSNIGGSIGYQLAPKFALGVLNLHARLVNPGVWPLALPIKYVLDLRAGDLYGDIELTGTLDRPQLGGWARVNKGDLYLPALKQLITDARAELTLDRNEIRITSIDGQSGGGTVHADGRVVLRGFTFVEDLTINVRTKSVELRPVPDIVVITTGEVNINWATQKNTLIAGVAFVEEALVAGEFGASGAPAAQSAAMDSLQIDIKVTADRKVWIRNALTDLEVSGQVNIRQMHGELSLLGELESRQGRVYTVDHAFRVTKGVLRFDNPHVIDPSLDITAELPSRIRDTTQSPAQTITILVNLTGTASRPVLTLSSDPAVMSQNDISYYLATNISPDEMNSGDDRATFNHMVSDRLLSYASRELSTRLGRYLQLDVLELSSTSLTSGANLKVTVGKYFGKNLFLSYTASTTQLAPDAFKLEYFLSTGQELVGERTEDGDYNVRWQFKFRY